MKLIFSISVILLLIGCTNTNNNTSKISVTGTVFPDFVVQNISGVFIQSIAKEINKGPFAVFVFDPDCQFCQTQTRDLIANSKLLDNVHIYMITVAPFRQMVNFNKEFKLDAQPNITLLRDSGRVTLRLFKLQALPFTAVYDQNHFLKSTFNGMVDTKTIVNGISKGN